MEEKELEVIEEVEKELKEERTPYFDIRQEKAWGYYINPKSETYGNANQSALKAGYTKTTSAAWAQSRFFKIKVRRLGMLNHAERVLKRTLLMNTVDDNSGKEMADLLRIKVDVAKHITKTLGKDEGYSERQEVTGKDGEQIVFMPAELLSKYQIPTEEPKFIENTHGEG